MGQHQRVPEQALLGMQVDKDLRQMLIKEDAPPAKTIGVRVWPKAIPQFNVGHLEVVQVRQCIPAVTLAHCQSSACQADSKRAYSSCRSMLLASLQTFSIPHSALVQSHSRLHAGPGSEHVPACPHRSAPKQACCCPI